MCIEGVCTTSTLAPLAACPFGDDVAVNQQTIFAPLPTAQMSCPDVFDFISTSLNQFPLSYCADSRFKAACCETCKSSFYIVVILIHKLLFYLFRNLSFKGMRI